MNIGHYSRKTSDPIALQQQITSDLADKLRSKLSAFAYWGKRMYPQVIAEFKNLSRLSGDEIDALIANALEEGFRSSGWKGALARAARALVAMRKSRYVSPYTIAELYAEPGRRRRGLPRTLRFFTPFLELRPTDRLSGN
jgi:hypothetical protein